MNPELKTDKPVKEKGKLVHRIYCSKCLNDNCEHFMALTKPIICKCGVPIIFARTSAGRLQPLRADTKESHFADCKYATDFRKKDE